MDAERREAVRMIKTQCWRATTQSRCIRPCCLLRQRMNKRKRWNGCSCQRNSCILRASCLCLVYLFLRRDKRACIWMAVATEVSTRWISVSIPVTLHKHLDTAEDRHDNKQKDPPPAAGNRGCLSKRQLSSPFLFPFLKERPESCNCFIVSWTILYTESKILTSSK